MCSECGETHKGSPSVSYRYPTYYYDLSEEERDARAECTDDLCHIKADPTDGSSVDIFYIRVILEIPIVGVSDPFTFGVWVSQSKESYERYVETFKRDQSDDFSFGWFTNTLPLYSDTSTGDDHENIECDVHWERIGKRPKIIFWESDHELSVDQRMGVSWNKAIKLAKLAIHNVVE